MKEIVYIIIGIMIVLWLVKGTFKMLKWIIIIALIAMAYKFFLPLL